MQDPAAAAHELVVQQDAGTADRAAAEPHVFWLEPDPFRLVERLAVGVHGTRHAWLNPFTALRLRLPAADCQQGDTGDATREMGT
jgi:hypothetical protein